MQVDVGNDKIHSNYSSFLAHPQAPSFQQNLKKEEEEEDCEGSSASRSSSSKSSQEEEPQPDHRHHHRRSRRHTPSHSARHRKRHSNSSSHRRGSDSEHKATAKRNSLSGLRETSQPSFPPCETYSSRRPPPLPHPQPQQAGSGSPLASHLRRAAALVHTGGGVPPLANRRSRSSISSDSKRMNSGGRGGGAVAVAPSSSGRGGGKSREGDGAIVNNADNNGSDRDGEEKENRKKDDAAVPKPGPKLAQTKIQLGMRLKRWMIVSRIGAGSFGETFTAIEVEGLLPPLDPEDDPLTITPEAEALLQNLPDEAERKEVCVKVEQENKNVLRLEVLALKKVQPCPQVVRYLSSGVTSGMNYLVMEKLGPNLAELRRRSPHGTFNIYTTLKAGISCLQAIRGVHEQGLVHRDIKPSNFVTGLPGGPDQATCFIIDFGLARRYRRSNGEIRPPRENAGFRGTSRYASVTSHHHQELGRVDDLWSLLFLLVEFATGTLPWRKYKDKDDIGRCKEESITPHLVRNLPREFQPFLAHLQTLRYEDEPDYDLLLALMHRSLERRGYPRDKPVDWELDPSMIEAADGEVAIQQSQPQQQQQALPPKAMAANGDARGENGPRPSKPFPLHLPNLGDANNDNNNNRSTPGRMSSSLPLPMPVGTRPSQQGGKGAASVSGSEHGDGDGERLRLQSSGNGLRVSDVEVSYQRSLQQNEESRSNLGVGSQRAGVAGKHSAPQSPRAAVMRPDDGSETPAAQASSSSRQGDAEDEYDNDNREFSPREQADDEVPAAPGKGKTQSTTAATAHKSDATPADSDKQVGAAGGNLLSPSPPAGDVEQSLDAIEQNAVNNPPPPPKQQPRKSPQSEQPQNGEEKTPKVKSKCNCAVM